MRTIKIVTALACFIIALIPTLVVLGDLNWFFNWPFAVCALGLIGIGRYLIAKRRTPLSNRFRLLTVSIIGLLVGFVVAIVIPRFVAGMLASSANACLINLRQIDAAKAEWALEKGKTNGTPVTEDDIKPYIKLDANGNLPKCGLGGTYIIGRVGNDPACSIGFRGWPNSHVLNYTSDSWWLNFEMAYGKLLGLDYAKLPHPDQH
jgi:hypothetical protein